MVWRLQEGHNSVPKHMLCLVVNTLFAIHLVQHVLYIQAYKHHIFPPHTDCKRISKLRYCWMEAKYIPSFISLPLSSIGDSAAHLISLRAKHTRTRYFYVSLRNKAGVLQLNGWEKIYPERITQQEFCWIQASELLFFFPCFNNCIFGVDQCEILYLVMVHRVQCNKLRSILLF